MRRLLAALMILLVGCATTAHVVPPPMVAENRRPELREMPQNPRDEALPEGIPTSPGESAVDPIEEGEPSPHSGILISEARAARDALFRVRYTELRRTYEADRQVWTAHRELYEEQLRRDREALEEAQPDWWERHDGTVIGVVAFVLGAAVTVGLAAAIDKSVGP